nr:hypothetical protein [Tanacetum cinerariifolium]
DNIISGLPSSSAITPNEPVLSTEEPDNSLSMRDEHLDAISAMESDEFIKSGVENLIPIPIVPPYLRSLQNEDIIFDPGICKSTFSRPDISHRCGTVKKFNTHRSHLNTCSMLIHGQNTPPLDVLLFHFYPP